MKKTHRLTIILLVLLIAGAVTGWFFTMDAGVALTQRLERRMARNKAAVTTGGAQAVLVDERPLQTAQSLAHNLGPASTVEEKHYAERATQLADHEVDASYAMALRQASHRTRQLNPQQRDLSDRIQKLDAQIKNDQQRLDAVMKSLAPQGSANLENLSDDAQLQIATAQTNLENDQNDLEEAKLALARIGGDATSKIERMKADHDNIFHRPLAPAAAATSGTAASSVASGPATAPTSADHQVITEVSAAAAEPTSLYGQVRDWSDLRGLREQIFKARDEANEASAALAKDHQALEEQVKAEEQGKATPEQADKAAQAQSTSVPANVPAVSATAKAPSRDLVALKTLAEDRRTLADLSKRLQNEQILGELYQHWADFIALRQRSLVHRILQSTILILLIMLAVSIADRSIDHIFASLTGERKRLFNLHGVAIFVMQATGVALCALVVFGLPSQLPTVIGLAGAGLTVALKDFIVGFIGWFILMGKNGIRVGDWVEVQGVGGEVIEISLLRTVLMETGNWNDSGHPTGRKVSFVNSYAIEGHYFNFSTTGQWLWDELPVLIPMGISPYEVIDGIQDVVAEETNANAKLAEEEWHRATAAYGVKSFSAAPSIDLRPTNFGIEVTVKYITRANERYDVRGRLNQKVVKLLHEKSVQAGIAPVSQKQEAPPALPAGSPLPSAGD